MTTVEPILSAPCGALGEDPPAVVGAAEATDVDPDLFLDARDREPDIFHAAEQAGLVKAERVPGMRRPLIRVDVKADKVLHAVRVVQEKQAEEVRKVVALLASRRKNALPQGIRAASRRRSPGAPERRDSRQGADAAPRRQRRTGELGGAA